MIAIALIVGLSLAIIAALAYFWQDIVNIIKKAVNMILEVLGVVVEGTKTFISRTRDGLKEKFKYYNQNKLTGEWEEMVRAKSVNESEVPPEILAKVRKAQLDEEVSTTEELRLQLGA